MLGLLFFRSCLSEAKVDNSVIKVQMSRSIVEAEAVCAKQLRSIVEAELPVLMCIFSI